MDALRGPEGTGTSLVFSEDIKLGRFVGLAFKNAFLTLLTLTLYRFWARTEVRRRVWAGTIINDQPLEYRGKGSELFVGFLIVVFGIILPISLIFAVAEFFFEEWVKAVLAFIIYLGLGALGGVAIYRARAYLMSRTSWRGVRFRQGPDWGFNFGLSVVGHTLLTAITLGWWAPRMRMRMARDLWTKTSWGDEPFVFNEGETRNLAGGLYKAFAVAWFGGIVILVCAIALIAGSIFAITGGGQPDTANPMIMLAIGGVVYGVLIPAIILAAFISLPYQAAVYRRIADKLRIDHLRFKLDVKSGPLFGLAVANLLTIVLSLGILSPLAAARSWRFMVRRLSTEGGIDLARIHQAADRGPGRGEGLADAFDVSILGGGL